MVKTCLALLVLAAFLSGCGGGTDDPEVDGPSAADPSRDAANPEDAARPEPQPDLGMDAPSDMPPDIAPDMLPDAAPDMPPDIAPDMPPDVAPDMPPDILPEPSCGDGVCQSEADEDPCTCPADCPGDCCGDSTCDASETPCTCPEDCPGDCCGDFECTGDETDCPDSCPGDCDPVCGDGCCTGIEDDTTCVQDCGCVAIPECGNGEQGEYGCWCDPCCGVLGGCCADWDAVCGYSPDPCGDGLCSPDCEDSSSCPQDCP